MIVMKIIGSILVITSSAGIGFFFSSEMKSRIEDLKELRNIVLLRGIYTMPILLSHRPSIP